MTKNYYEMNLFESLNEWIDLQNSTIQKELDILTTDSQSLERYKKQPKANTLLVNAKQESLNRRFDNLDILENGISLLPLIISDILKNIDQKSKEIQKAQSQIIAVLAVTKERKE